jgi:Arc/MetJ family transcription regulator
MCTIELRNTHRRIIVRTNIVIDDSLMATALNLSDYKTKKETVEEALKLFIAMKNQSSIRKYKGRLHWEGNLEKMRLDK